MGDWLFKPNVKKFEEKTELEGLIFALLYETNWTDVRIYAAKARGHLGDIRSVESLIAAPGDSNEYVRECTAYPFGEIGDPIGIKPLIAVL